MRSPSATFTCARSTPSSLRADADGGRGEDGLVRGRRLLAGEGDVPRSGSVGEGVVAVRSAARRARTRHSAATGPPPRKRRGGRTTSSTPGFSASNVLAPVLRPQPSASRPAARDRLRLARRTSVSITTSAAPIATWSPTSPASSTTVARDRRLHLDRRLVGHHVGELLVLLDAVADRDVPRDDLGLGNALADVRQLEGEAAPSCVESTSFMIFLSALPIRHRAAGNTPIPGCAGRACRSR